MIATSTRDGKRNVVGKYGYFSDAHIRGMTLKPTALGRRSIKKGRITIVEKPEG